jgi:xylulokinase
MEGVVFALRQGLDLMQGLGVPVTRVLASGGSTRHPLWLQLQADIFNHPVFIDSLQEATARGAAMLAGVGVGLYRDGQEACRIAVRTPDTRVMPREEFTDLYQVAYQVYCQLYPALHGAKAS